MPMATPTLCCCFFVVVVLLPNFMLHVSLVASNETVDQDALLVLKSRITLDPLQIVSKNWSSDTSVCRWKGVSCSGSSHPRVTILNLSGFGFGGTVPSNLGNLTFLNSLNFRSNNFTGFLPHELSRLRRLQHFDVGFNNFTGGIPSWFENLGELQSVFLDHNKFSGSIPRGIFNLSSIDIINLSDNILSGTLPEDICNYVPKLRGFSVSLNQLSGQIPFDIYKCSELQNLSLSSNHFNGSIPESIGWLTNIRNLYIGGNDFLPGAIPTNLRNLSHLQTLSFFGASLNGKIPSFIFNMSSLEILIFSNNSLSGSITDAVRVNLPNLRVLYLQSNQLMGSIPKHLGNLTTLEYLVLSGNNFTGALPRELGNLNLVGFGVDNNNLSGRIPSSIFNMSRLNQLALASNYFSGQLPSNFGLPLTSLQELYLNNNQLSGRIPSSITNASNLVTLSMGENLFSGPVPHFGDLRLLQRLFIGGNNLTGESQNQELRFLSSLTSCRHLREIDLPFNQLDGMLPRSIGNLSSTLTTFRAFGCGIKGSIPVEIGNLTNLRDLYLDSNKLTGFIPRTLGNLEQLIRVYLEYNKLEGLLPVDLCRLRNLGDFYVSHNALQGPIPACFGTLQTLQRFFLDSNKLESSVPSSLWNLNHLLSLNLSTNKLNGPLSLEIGNLKALSELDLSLNEFSGEVPSSIGNAESLVILSLEHNNFQGSIPESLGNLRGLETLDLSFNNFSGSIPDSLERLIYLQSFNVSYNRLEGPIPTKGKFANFTSSFMGNNDLCSAARLRVRPCEENKRKTGSVTLVKYIVPPVVLGIILLAITILLIMRRQKLRRRTALPNVDVFVPQSIERKSYLELARATNDFNESNLLGRGSYGSVFVGTLSDGETIAVKVFDLESEQATKSFNTEISLLCAIRHKNLIKILGYCSNPGFKALILEYMPRQSLEKWLYSHNHFLDLLQTLNIAMDVAFALQHLHLGHTFPIVHCDLKPSNVLLDEDMIARVSDFGIAKLFGENEVMTQTRTLATMGYMAPEFGAEGIVSVGCDVYSFGIMLLELCTRKRPTDEMFGGDLSLESWVRLSLSENKIDEVVDANLLGDLDNLLANEQCLSSVLHLAMKCLAVSPTDRISISVVVTKLEQIRAVYMATKGSSRRGPNVGK